MGGRVSPRTAAVRITIALAVLAFFSGCDCRGGAPCRVDSDCEDDGRFCTREFCNIGRCTRTYNVCDVDGLHCSEAEDRCIRLVDSGPPPDSGFDAGPVCGPALEGAFGASCPPAGLELCRGDLACYPDLTFPLGGVSLFLRSVCARECDPAGAGAECRDCGGRCTDRLRAGSVYVEMARWGAPALCLVGCEPSLDGDGCERPFHSCDPRTGTCQQSCRSSDECRLVTDAAGEVRFDPTRPAECDFVTGRCRLLGTPGARAGDTCVEDTDCADDGTCLSGGAWGSEGYCARFGCEWPALACGGGEVCDGRELERPACLAACTVAAEAEEARLGPGGHGDSCRAGFACRWSDGAPPSTLTGACVPGNYNGVAEPNLGAACTRDDECYSPFGYGRCLGAEAGGRSGVCAVRDCFVGTSPVTGEAILEGLLPGIRVPLPVCPAATEPVSCVEVSGARWCLPRCATAEDCTAGFACRDRGVCHPDCASDADCRGGELCVTGDGSACTTGAGCRCRPAP